MNIQEIKKALFQACEAHIEKRMKTIRDRLTSIEESRNEETKSSAGDKYETGRAMMQMEEDKAKKQLSEILLTQKALSEINYESSSEQVRPGSLVLTDHGRFYMAVGIGKVKYDDESYFCISPHSPIGQLLIGKKQGEEFTFNGLTRKIESVY
jgi:transcription elongation GreA/GreB family factor